MKVLFFVLVALFFLNGCGSGSADNKVLSKETVTQSDISNLHAIEYLSKSTFYFPAIDPATRTTTFQALERFDVIFVGHDLDSKYNFLATSIPGIYTHVLTYLGKDSDGFAYAVEMNSDENLNYSAGIEGLKVNGRLFIYCLGNDFGHKQCPKDDYIHGLEIYDYMWAKQLDSELKQALKMYEDDLLATIKQDLDDSFPFQIPLHIGVETESTKIIPLINDGRLNGADCTAYVTSLFEEIAGVCLEDTRINAAMLEDYYLNDPVGQQAAIPEEYNFFTEGNLYFSELITTLGYSFVDNIPRKTACPDGRTVTGFPTPDKVFNSPSMLPVQTVDARFAE